jgi:chromate transport protein ChrA
LQGLVQSFRFQVPPKPFPTNTAYNIGYQVARTLGAWAGGTLAIAGMLACPAALIVAAYFLFRKKK